MDPAEEHAPPPLEQPRVSIFVGFLLQLIVSTLVYDVMHTVPEGHVGVYWRGGVLLKTVTDPGVYLKMPFLTHFEPVQVTLRTDTVTDVPCGTKEGAKISFEKIEVVYQLRKDFVYETLLNYGLHYNKKWINDNIQHEINKFCHSHTLQQFYAEMFDQIDEKMKDALQSDCNRYAPGIKIISVRVTQSAITNSIGLNFEPMAEELAKVIIVVEGQKVVKNDAEMLKEMAVSEDERNTAASKIQKLLEKDDAKHKQRIEDEISADTHFYRVTRGAKANKLRWRHTTKFLELKLIDPNSTSFYEDKVYSAVSRYGFRDALKHTPRSVKRGFFNAEADV